MHGTAHENNLEVKLLSSIDLLNDENEILCYRWMAEETFFQALVRTFYFVLYKLLIGKEKRFIKYFSPF